MSNEPSFESPSPKRRGRPSTGDAKSSAERMKARRDRLRAEGKVELSCFVSQQTYDALVEEAINFSLTKDDVVDLVLRNNLIASRVKG
jgi:hypothetical protein